MPNKRMEVALGTLFIYLHSDNGTAFRPMLFSMSRRRGLMPVDGKFYGMFDIIVHQINPFVFLHYPVNRNVCGAPALVAQASFRVLGS